MGSNHTNQLLFLDEETGGLGETAEIWEWACIEEDGTETQVCMPIDVSKAEEDALRVNNYWLRFDDAFKRYGMSPADGALVMTRKTAGKTIIGNNVGPFDVRHMRNHITRHGLKPAWNFRVIEVVDFAAGALGLKHPYTARQISEALGIERNGDEHTALGDARWNKKVYELAVKLGGREHKLQTLKSGLLAVLKSDFQEDEPRLIEIATKWAETLMPEPEKKAKASA